MDKRQNEDGFEQRTDALEPGTSENERFMLLTPDNNLCDACSGWRSGIDGKRSHKSHDAQDATKTGKDMERSERHCFTPLSDFLYFRIIVFIACIIYFRHR